MGWCSGTQLFDDVMKTVLTFAQTDAERVYLFKEMIDLFTDKDWDCEGDSRYWSDPDFQLAYKLLFPDG